MDSNNDVRQKSGSTHRMSEQSRNAIERSGLCDRCYTNSDELVAVTTIVNGMEQKEWVCPSCEPDAREDEKPAITKVRTDGGVPESDTERGQDISKVSLNGKRGVSPLNLTRDEKHVLVACVEMMDDNITVECEGEESVRAFESLKSKVNRI